MRVVLDTNVWISALLWSGVPYRVLERLETSGSVITATPALLNELKLVLHRTKFASRLEALELTPDEVLTVVLNHVQLFPDVPKVDPPIVRADPHDDHVLLGAFTAQAQMVITVDQHLLQWRHDKNIPIVTPAQALRLLSQ